MIDEELFKEIKPFFLNKIIEISEE